MLGLEIADCVHKQTYLKHALPVNRRLSLEPGRGLSCQRVALASPGLAPAPQSVFLTVARGPAQAGAGAWGLPTPLSSGLLHPTSPKLSGPGEGAVFGEDFPLDTSHALSSLRSQDRTGQQRGAPSITLHSSEKGHKSPPTSNGPAPEI